MANKEIIFGIRARKANRGITQELAEECKKRGLATSALYNSVFPLIAEIMKAQSPPSEIITLNLGVVKIQ